MKIFVVFGQTGEYSDYREWPVKAFVCEEKTKKFMEDVTAEYKRLRDKYSKGRYDSWSYRVEEVERLDPKMETDYTGTTYHYFEMELDAER